MLGQNAICFIDSSTASLRVVYASAVSHCFLMPIVCQQVQKLRVDGTCRNYLSGIEYCYDIKRSRIYLVVVIKMCNTIPEESSLNDI